VQICRNALVLPTFTPRAFTMNKTTHRSKKEDPFRDEEEAAKKGALLLLLLWPFPF
jgi:hypothetical protein